MVYGLEDFEVDIPNDKRMNTLESFTNELLSTKTISQHDVTELENKLGYNILTKIMPLKSYTLVRSGTNVNDTLYYIKEFKKEYFNLKRRINEDKSALLLEIEKTIRNIYTNLIDINTYYNKECDIDTLFANRLADKIRTKTNAHFDDLVSSLTEYSKYCKVNGINDTFFNVSPLDILIKMYKYDDLEISNIINQLEMELTCIDIYHFLNEIVNDQSIIDVYINRLEKMILNVNMFDCYTFKQYEVILDTLKLSAKFTETIANFYKVGEVYYNF